MVPPDDACLIRLIQELPDVVIVIDGSGRVLWGNRAAERLFARSLDTAVGMSGLALVHPEDLEFVLLSLGTIQNKTVGAPIEIRLNTPTGWRLMELVGAPGTLARRWISAPESSGTDGSTPIRTGTQQ